MKSLALDRPFVLALSSLACACINVGPDYEAPELELPGAHATELSALPGSDAVQEELDLVQWWDAFEDPLLTELIERAVERNFDLRAALARVTEAEAVLGIERVQRGPRADLSAVYARTGISENTQFGLFPGQARESDDYTLGLGATWEIDLWGRTRRTIEAAEAELDARLDDHAAARVSLLARVADAYLRLRELQRREWIARENLVVLSGILDTSSARFQAGLTEELDVFRARTELERARALLPETERGRAAAATELEILLGIEPGTLADSLRPPPDAHPVIPLPSGRVTAQIPADLLRRRPDLRSAERQLAAQTARVGIATAALYPSLTLLGNIGQQSEKIGDLFSNGSGTHGFGPSISVPILARSGLKARIRAEDARVEQALVEYERTVMLALHEVDGAAKAIGFERSRLDALERAHREAGSSLESSTTLYREGLISLDDVLDARRTLLGIEDSRARARSAASRAHVDLYRALGGGWPGAEDGDEVVDPSPTPHLRDSGGS